MKDCLIIQFAKFPRLGAVKTRLQPALGQQGCYQLHIKLVNHVNGVLQTVSADHMLFLDQLGSLPAIDNIAIHTPIMLQQGEDLGARMENAMAWGLKHYQKVIIVGSDCPAITGQHYSEVMAGLENNDHVFVPAEDGGYVLIGAKKVFTPIYNKMPWGTEQVMEKTLQKLHESGEIFLLLDNLWDVDRQQDYERLINQMPSFEI